MMEKEETKVNNYFYCRIFSRMVLSSFRLLQTTSKVFSSHRSLSNATRLLKNRSNDKSSEFNISLDDLKKGLKTEISSESVDIDSKIKELKNKDEKARRERLETKEFSSIEKYVLFRIGRFKSLEEVPNKIKYESVQAMNDDKEYTIGLLKENGFKIFTGANFMLWFITALMVFYVSSNYYKFIDKENKDSEKPSA